MSARDVVLAYYKGIPDAEKLQEYLHPQFSVEWTSTRGYMEFSKKEILIMMQQLAKTNAGSRIEVREVIEEGNNVSVKYDHYINPLDTPTEEKLYSKSLAMWKVENNKLLRGYVMSFIE